MSSSQREAWPKNERLRQLVVRAANPQNRVIQVSILTDDSKAAAVEIVRLMFNRWVQENDFKYLDKHYGINQITSYGVTGYDELRQQQSRWKNTGAERQQQIQKLSGELAQLGPGSNRRYRASLAWSS